MCFIVQSLEVSRWAKWVPSTAILMKALRNLRLVALALAVVILAGTAGFHFIEGWPWFDGFYMMVTTLTTIGYQETHTLSHAGRVFNVALIVAGVSLVFLAIGTLTQALLEFELRSFFGRRKMEREIDRLTDHYIICGAGRVGRSVRVNWHAGPRRSSSLKQEKSCALQSRPAAVSGRCHPGTNPARGPYRARPRPGGRYHNRRNQCLYRLHRPRLNPKLKIIARASEEDAEKHLLTAGADSVVSRRTISRDNASPRAFCVPMWSIFLDTATTHLGIDLEIDEIWWSRVAVCRQDH